MRALALVLLVTWARCLLKCQLNVLAALDGHVGALEGFVVILLVSLFLTLDRLALHFPHARGHPLRCLHPLIKLSCHVLHHLVIILRGHILQLRYHGQRS